MRRAPTLARLVLLAALAGACRAKPASIRIVPATLRVAPGQEAMLHVEGVDAAGQPMAASLEHPTGFDVAWSSSDASIALVQRAALERQWRPEASVTGKAPGATRVFARCCDGLETSATVLVVPPPP